MPINLLPPDALLRRLLLTLRTKVRHGDSMFGLGIELPTRMELGTILSFSKLTPSQHPQPQCINSLGKRACFWPLPSCPQPQFHFGEFQVKIEPTIFQATVRPACSILCRTLGQVHTLQVGLCTDYCSHRTATKTGKKNDWDVHLPKKEWGNQFLGAGPPGAQFLMFCHVNELKV
eukprot:180137-Pelagomonas_calceolata.AAC.1